MSEQLNFFLLNTFFRGERREVGELIKVGVFLKLLVSVVNFFFFYKFFLFFYFFYFFFFFFYDCFFVFGWRLRLICAFGYGPLYFFYLLFFLN